MTFDELRDRTTELAEEMLSDATETSAKTFGLDPRAGYQLWLTAEHDAIGVTKARDGQLQYYGGFEYVDKDCRFELGDYVFYSAEDSRVEGHINIALDVEEDEDSTPEDAAASAADLENDAEKCGDAR